MNKILWTAVFLFSTAFYAINAHAAAITPGSFRFATTSLPRGSTNVVYAATLFTVNGAGPVTFSISAGSLPPGLALNAQTGFISGIPTVVNASGTPVTFSATDGTSTTTFATSISVTAAGGGGSPGLSFTTTSFPDGRIGVAYSVTIGVTGGSTTSTGLTQIVFGAEDLPAGLSLNGATGAISGTPTSAGTYFVTVTATDKGDNSNKALVVLALTVLPAASDFRFTTLYLNNGEVGIAYSFPMATNPSSGVTFGAIGLPPGLSIAPATGIISGTPTTPGTFVLSLSATDGTDTIVMNRVIAIVPNGSNFYWAFNGGLPAAFLNQPYAPPSPPILLVTENPGPGGGVVYSAVGLPSGIVYDPSTGQFSGTPLEAGIFPVTYTATAGTQVITFNLDFIVFPPGGGDTNSLSVNLWVKKLQLKKTGTAQKDSFQAQFIYNADRRLLTTPPSIYDVSTNPIIIDLGSIPEVNIPRASLTGSRPKFVFKSPKSTLPSIALALDESAETITVSGKGETITDTLPGILPLAVKLGTKGYKLDLFLDAKGKFTATSGYRKTSFVVATAKLTAKTAGKDSASFSMYLADPAFMYPGMTGATTARFRLLDTAGTIVDEDFSTLVTNKSGKLSTGKDATAPFIKFTYDTKSGKLSLSLKSATLVGKLAATEDHVSVELSLGDKVYFTAITLFAPKTGSYSNKLP